MQTVQLLLTALQLTPKSIQGAVSATGQAQSALVLLRALMSRGGPGLQLAAESLACRRDEHVLTAEVFRQWQAAEGRAKELEDCWPALQQLLVDILASQQQLQAGSADISTPAVSAVTAAVQAATGVLLPPAVEHRPTCLQLVTQPLSIRWCSGSSKCSPATVQQCSCSGYWTNGCATWPSSWPKCWPSCWPKQG
jgi:hypothetical protein